MTYYTTRDMTREHQQLLLDWLEAEGIDPMRVRDDGRFSVHNGRVSGNKFIFSAADLKMIRGGKVLSVHFHQDQKNPLPEELC